MLIEVGEYLTRNGLKVVIFDVKDNGATFNRHGYIHLTHSPSSGKKYVKVQEKWDIWDKNGNHTYLPGSAWDLVTRVE